MTTYETGDIGSGAVVQQGSGLVNVTLQLGELSTVEQVQALIDEVRRATGNRPVFGAPLRRLEPLVLVNRRAELDLLLQALDSTASVTIVEGLAGVGKSTLVRGALELRSSDVPAVWLPAEATPVHRLLAVLDTSLALGIGVGHDDVISSAGAVLAAVRRPVVVVLDGAEALLDDQGRYSSPDYTALFGVLTTVEHPVKLVMTTRRRPAEPVVDRATVRLVTLRGLDDEASRELLVQRAGERRAQDAVDTGLVARLGGNPKLIELLAASLDDLPLSLLAQDLPEATSIGDYVVREVLARLADAERALLRTAALFREPFDAASLAGLHARRCGREAVAVPLRGLVQRALVEPAGEGSYYVHPMVVVGVEPPAAEAAEAHVTTAAWYLEAQEDPVTAVGVGEALFHLRRAVELAPTAENLQRLADFVTENSTKLDYGGYGRALIEAADLVLASEQAGLETGPLGFLRAQQLWVLGEHEEALGAFEELWSAARDDLARMRADHPEDVAALSAQAGLLVTLGQKLGDTVLALGDVDRAASLADELEPFAATHEDPHIGLRYAELRWEIARSRSDVEDMLRWARFRFELAHAWHEEEPGARGIDAIAEAHFALAVSYLRAEAWAPMFRNLRGQLRRKLDIDKVQGVAAALGNIGHLVSRDEPDVGTMMLATAAMLLRKVGSAKSWDAEDLSAAVERLRDMAADPDRVEYAKRRVGELDPRLMRYAEAAAALSDPASTGSPPGPRPR